MTFNFFFHVPVLTFNWDCRESLEHIIFFFPPCSPMHLESVDHRVFRVSSFPLKLALSANEKKKKKYIYFLHSCMRHICLFTDLLSLELFIFVQCRLQLLSILQVKTLRICIWKSSFLGVKRLWNYKVNALSCSILVSFR